MRVLVVDDDRLVTMSLKTILESDDDIEVSGMGFSGEDAIRLYEKDSPDVLLMDIRMDGMSGLDASGCILAKHPDAKILLLTTFSDDEYIIKALSLGTRGYIIKQKFESIVPSVKAVYMGQSVFGGEVVSRFSGIINTKKDKDTHEKNFDEPECGLTQKEMEVTELVAKGLNNKEIGEQLYLSEGTVRNYISFCLEKTGLRDRTQLAIWYLDKK